MIPLRSDLVRTGTLLAASCALGCASAGPRASSRALAATAGERIVVVSQPRGALIVFDGDTLAPAPVAFRYDRTGVAGIPHELYLVAVPSDTGGCLQHRIVAYNEPTPDTVRFEMHRCPARTQDLGRLFEDSEVTAMPERIASPPVRYPDRLRQAGIQGTVILRFVVDTTGRADSTSMEVLLSSHRDFAPVAREVCLRSTYEPGRLYDRKVRVRVRMPINFSIARAH